MILAAGEGTRLQPLTYSFPKPLVPIANKPVLEHILAWLSNHGITEIVMNTHYLAEEIEAHVGDGTKFGVTLHFSREEQLWGTAGSVKRVEDLFTDTFLVIGCDDLCDIDLSKLVRFHRQNDAVATIGLKEVRDTSQYGVAVLDSTGKILRFQEKPKPEEALSRLANTGIYLFRPEIFNFIPKHEVFDFGRQVFPLLLEKKAGFFGAEVEGYWCDIGSLAEYKESHWAILEGRCRVLLPASEMKPGIWLEEPALIHPSATLSPPCVIGKGSVVSQNAVLSGHVVTGRNTVIGKNSRLDHVIAWNDCKIGENVFLQDCVVSQGVTVSEGVDIKQTVITP